MMRFPLMLFVIMLLSCSQDNAVINKTYIIKNDSGNDTIHEVENLSNVTLYSKFTDKFDNEITENYHYNSNNELIGISRISENSLNDQEISIVSDQTATRNGNANTVVKTVSSNNQVMNFDETYALENGRVTDISRTYRNFKIKFKRNHQ